jgi:ABC-type sugar transport system permease subunit
MRERNPRIPKWLDTIVWIVVMSTLSIGLAFLIAGIIRMLLNQEYWRGLRIIVISIVTWILFEVFTRWQRRRQQRYDGNSGMEN